jgi:hypothetical protein
MAKRPTDTEIIDHMIAQGETDEAIDEILSDFHRVYDTVETHMTEHGLSLADVTEEAMNRIVAGLADAHHKRDPHPESEALWERDLQASIKEWVDDAGEHDHSEEGRIRLAAQAARVAVMDAELADQAAGDDDSDDSDPFAAVESPMGSDE